MPEVVSGLNVTVVYTWSSIDVVIMVLMCSVVFVHTLQTGSKILTTFNILLCCMFTGWIMASITDALWYGYRVITLQTQDLLGYLGPALTMNGYVYLILARTKVLAETVFPSFTKPLNYLSRIFFIVSLIPVLISVINLFLSVHPTLIHTLDKVSAYVNIVAGLLIAVFDIICVIMFLKLHKLVSTNNIENVTFKIIGKWGLYSSTCVLLATIFFAIHVAADIKYTQFVSRTFGVLTGAFLVYMKISLSNEDKSLSRATRDMMKSGEYTQKTRDNTKGTILKKEMENA